MKKLILTAALLAAAAPAFAEEHAATVLDQGNADLPAIETTLADEVSGTDTLGHGHAHDTGDMFDEAAPTAEEAPAAE